MKFTKKVAALILTGALCACGLGASTFAAEGHVIKENSAKFEVSIKRQVWGQGHSYEGHQGKITISNKDAVALNNWTLEFDYDGEIKSVSNAVLVSRVGNHYVIAAPKTWNTRIEPQKTLTFEFQGRGTRGDLDLNNIYLNSVQKPVKVTTIRPWALKQTYAVGDQVTYNGKVYKCRIAHRVDAPNWTPTLAPTLWSKANLKVAAPYDVLIQN